MIIPFHVVVREKNKVLKKLKWYKWLVKPDFYLVSGVSIFKFNLLIARLLHFPLSVQMFISCKVCTGNYI